MTCIKIKKSPWKSLFLFPFSVRPSTLSSFCFSEKFPFCPFPLSFHLFSFEQILTPNPSLGFPSFPWPLDFVLLEQLFEQILPSNSMVIGDIIDHAHWSPIIEKKKSFRIGEVTLLMSDWIHCCLVARLGVIGLGGLTQFLLHQLRQTARVAGGISRWRVLLYCWWWSPLAGRWMRREVVSLMPYYVILCLVY